MQKSKFQIRSVWDFNERRELTLVFEENRLCWKEIIPPKARKCSEAHVYGESNPDPDKSMMGGKE